MSIFSKINPFSRIKKLENDNIKLREMYAAAKNSRLIGGWSPSNVNVNEIIAASSPAVRARVRQLVRDFPYFARAFQKSKEYIVGDGIKFQSKILTPQGDLDKNLINLTEAAYNYWADNADYSGKMHLHEIQALIQGQKVEAGEYFAIKHYPRNVSGVPFKIQLIEGDQLTGLNTKPINSGNEIIDGIEINSVTGAPVVYHFSDEWGKATPIPANRIIHGFDILRPGQIRGISPFVSGVLLANDFSQYLQANLDRAKMASKWLAFITYNNSSLSGGFDFTGNRLDENENGEKIEYLENAILQYLRPGEEVKLSSDPGVGSDFNPYVRLLLTMLSITTNIPYELLSGDYQGMNYTVIRASRNDFEFALRPEKAHHIRHFETPILKDFMDMGVLSGVLPYRDYFQKPWLYQAAEWQPPGMPAVDPLKDTKAAVEAIKNNLKSKSEVSRARGRDYENIAKEIKLDKEIDKEYDIESAEETSSMINTSPSKLNEVEESKDNAEKK